LVETVTGVFMSKLIRAVLSDEKGATSIEYGLICALIAVVSIAAVGTLGQKAESVYTQVNMAMSGSGSGVGGAGAGGPAGGGGFGGSSRGGSSGGRSGGGGFSFNP
jgi:pilus assembly protein Flp/PilA